VHSECEWESNKACYRPPWGGGKDVDFGEEFEHWTGPKSAESVNSLFHRLIDLYYKIKSEGYKPWSTPDGFIRVCLLEKPNGERRCLVVSGQHRAAIISHLGYKSAWVRLQHPGELYPNNMPNQIKMSQIDTWEKVVSQDYTRRDAQRIFECYFEHDGNTQAKSIGLL